MISKTEKNKTSPSSDTVFKISQHIKYTNQ
jgi:hypothetical protein